MDNSTQTTTQVFFCYNKRENDLFAVFPEVRTSMPIFRMSYAHIGQHSEAHILYIQEAKQATKKQYSDLLKELQGIYTEGLQVITKKEAGF